MLTTLLDSPAGSRSMRAFTLPWQNLATFGLPDFWGNPVSHNWWYQGNGNYPEFITYLGIVPIVLAGVAVAFGRNVRTALAVVVGTLALMQMYGWPPGAWLGMLPGLRQMNPYRWNVALAFSVALLAAGGLDVLLRRRDTTSGTRPSANVLAAVAGPAALAVLAVLALWNELDVIRGRGLQPFEKWQLARFAVWSLLAVGLAAMVAAGRRWRLATVAAWLLVVTAAADLVYAGYGFNPTAPRWALYRTTPGLSFLRREVADRRIAPVGAPYLLPQSHVWGMFGLPSVTGFDFFGDQAYQTFIARTQHARSPRTDSSGPVPARWDHVGLTSPADLDLRLLGLLGVSLIVTPPVDLMTHDAGYTTVGELTDGRVVEQTFTARQNGLHRIDLLVGTYARRNEGRWHIRLSETDASRAMRDGLAAWTIDTARLRDLDWLSLTFEPRAASAGRRYVIRVEAAAGAAGTAATLMATDEGGLPSGSLAVDAVPDPRALWMRTFSRAPSLVPGATLAYAHDLNVYRNPEVQPPAWFVTEARVIPAGHQLDVMTEPAFDPRATVVVEEALEPPGQRDAGDSRDGLDATITSADLKDPDRLLYRVSAPRGGIVVFSERFDPHWMLLGNGARRLRLVRANAVLMAAVVPPGVTTLELRYQRRDWIGAAAVSALALAGILIALTWRR
jgi:hypothetical protein